MIKKFCTKTFMLFFTLLLFSCNSDTNFNNAPSGAPEECLGKFYKSTINKYDSISHYTNGIAIAFKDKKQGLIDYKGKTRVECVYDSLGIISFECIVAKNQDKYGIIKNDGNIMTEFEYEKICYQKGGNRIPSLFFVLKDKWGVVDSTGIERIPCLYDKIEPKEKYTEKDSTFVFIIEKDNLTGICNFNHEELIEVKYDGILLFYNSYGFLFKNGKWGIFNKDFQIVTECLYDDISFPNDSSCKYVTVRKGTYSHGKYGIIEISSGEIIIPFIYKKLEDYKNEQLILAKNNKDKFGFIDINNNIVIPFEYDDAKNFSEGLAYVAKYKGYATLWFGETVRTLKSGFINKKGEIVIPLKFADNSIQKPYFKEGLAPIGIGVNNIFANLFGYINTKGEFVIEPQFQEANPFKNGVASVMIKDKVGMIDKNGDFIIPAVYDDTWDNKYNSIGDTIIKLKRNDKEYSFKLNGAAI